MTTSMTIDDVFDQTGSLGRRQWIFVLILCILRSQFALSSQSYAFVRRHIPFKCTVANDSGTFELEDHCHEECGDISFDTSEESSIESEWSLVCEDKWLNPLTYSINLLSSTIGSLFMGHIADSMGRKPVIIFAFTLLAMSSLAGGIFESYIVYCITRSVAGFCFCNALAVLLYELVGSSKRAIVSAVFSVGWAGGSVFLSLLAYMWPHWRHLYYAITFYSACGLTLIFFLPESPRWLLAKGKVVKAKRILRSIGKGNGHPIGDDFDLQQTNLEGHECSKKLTFKSFLMDKMMIIMLATITYTSGVLMILYSAVYLLAGPVSGNLYIGTAVSAIVEVPGDFLGAFIMDRLGRKRTVALFLISGGLSSLCLALTTSSVLATILIMFQKVVVSSAYGLFYVHINELIPTPVRSTTIGFTSVIGSCFHALTPYIVNLDDFYPNLHFYVLAGIGISAGVLNWLCLPETAGRNLPETIDDVKALFKPKLEERVSDKDDASS